MTYKPWLTLMTLAFVTACSGTEKAKEAVKDANEEVADERKDVDDAARKLEEEEGELREAEAEADAKTVRLENQITKDTATRSRP